MVIVGHTRLQAVLKLGLKFVPVQVADLTLEQVRAYRLAKELEALATMMDADRAAFTWISPLPAGRRTRGRKRSEYDLPVHLTCAK